MENYTITHIGELKFQVTTETGEIKEAGSNLRGMIRYTYFEDYSLPEIGWEITRKQLLEDHGKKVLKNLSNGNLKLN